VVEINGEAATKPKASAQTAHGKSHLQPNFHKKIQKDAEEYEKIDRFIENDIAAVAKRLKMLGLEGADSQKTDISQEACPLSQNISPSD
jgi:hypothetical protein